MKKKWSKHTGKTTKIKKAEKNEKKWSKKASKTTKVKKAQKTKAFEKGFQT